MIEPDPHDGKGGMGLVDEAARNRIWEHRLHEDLVSNDRQNFFLIAQSLVIVAFSELYDHKAPAAIVAGAGLVLTIVWLYVAMRMRAIVRTVHLRATHDVQDFARTWALRPSWFKRTPSSADVLAYGVPPMLSALWVLLGAAALLSW